MNDYEPDICELQSWLSSETNPELIQIWEASKYLSSPYQFWLSVWKQYGRPDIFELA